MVFFLFKCMDFTEDKMKIKTTIIELWSCYHQLNVNQIHPVHQENSVWVNTCKQIIRMHLTLCGCWWLRQEATCWDANGTHPLNQVSHVPCTLLSPWRLRGFFFWLTLCFLDLFGVFLQFLKNKTQALCFYSFFSVSIIKLSFYLQDVKQFCGLYS